jgi:hypothetical protein
MATMTLKYQGGRIWKDMSAVNLADFTGYFCEVHEMNAHVHPRIAPKSICP